MKYSSMQFVGDNGFYVSKISIISETDTHLTFKHGKSKEHIIIPKDIILKGPVVVEGDPENDWDFGNTYMIIDRDSAKIISDSTKRKKRKTSKKCTCIQKNKKKEMSEKGKWMASAEGQAWIQKKKDAGEWKENVS